MSACSITNCRDGIGGAPWPPTKDLNPHSVVRSHVSCPVERMGDNWGQGWDLNPRPSGYEPDELPTAPPCYIGGVLWLRGLQTHHLLSFGHHAPRVPLAPLISYRGTTLSLGKRRYSARLPFSPWPSLPTIPSGLGPASLNLCRLRTLPRHDIEYRDRQIAFYDRTLLEVGVLHYAFVITCALSSLMT